MDYKDFLLGGASLVSDILPLLACLQIWPNFRFGPWTLVYGVNKYSMSGQRDMSELNFARPRVRIINKRNATALQFFLKMFFNITLTSYNSLIHYTPNYAQPLLLPTKGVTKSGRKATESGRVRLIYECVNIARLCIY